MKYCLTKVNIWIMVRKYLSNRSVSNYERFSCGWKIILENILLDMLKYIILVWLNMNFASDLFLICLQRSSFKVTSVTKQNQERIALKLLKAVLFLNAMLFSIYLGYWVTIQCTLATNDLSSSFLGSNVLKLCNHSE